MRFGIAFILLFSLVASASNVERYRFDAPEQETTYKALVQELRCLVCQNQNIADSNAELAQDMRRKTYELVSQGKSKQEVADYMAERYGDFVLYKPPFKASTAVLWIGPFALLLLGLWLFMRTIRARQQAVAENMVSPEQLQEAADLLNSQDKNS